MLTGFVFLPRLIGSLRWLVASNLAAWAAFVLVVVVYPLAAWNDGEQTPDSTLQDHALAVFFWGLLVGGLAYGLTLGSVSRGIEIRQGRTTNLAERAWQICFVALFALPGIPLLIYGN